MKKDPSGFSNNTMNTPTQNIRKIMEELKSINTTEAVETHSVDIEHTASMLRTFAKEILNNTKYDMAAAYMIRGADIIDELLAKISNKI